MKKFLCLLLALALVIPLLPAPARAADSMAAERKNLADSWRYTAGQLRPAENTQEPEPDPEPTHPNATLRGIDVSAWQETVDWERVKADGVDFVILRCGYGMDMESQDDTYFAYNATECERLGIPYGVYLYSYADSVERANSEADHVLRLIQGRNLSYPVFFDMEDNSTLEADLPAIAKTFCDKIAAAGYPVGVYSSTYWWNNYLTDPCFNNWYRWVAQYYDHCTYAGNYTMWQYSSSGSVDGINGPVDMNYQIGYPTDHGTPGCLSTDRMSYPAGEPIWVTTDYEGENAWVGLFRTSDTLTSEDTRPLFRFSLQEVTNPVDILTTRAEQGTQLEPGSYTIALFADLERTLVATAPITVTKGISSQETYPATCTEDGSIIITYVDGTTEVTVLPALGHDWDEGTVTREPSGTLPGEIFYTCLRCGETVTQPFFPGQDTGVVRIKGADRYETAFKTADTMKQVLGISQFDTIVVASGTGFADALGGSYLAYVNNAPILLASAAPNDQPTADYILENLAPGGKVYILGGTAAVPDTMEVLLEGLNVVRLAGKDRYETNLAILEETGVVPGSEILVCTGSNFADSLSCSATGMPILLLNNQSGTLSVNQQEFMALANANYCIVGGTGAISEDLGIALIEYGFTRRLSGKDRHATSVLVAENFFTHPSAAVLAYSQNFPDGLCGGALAASLNIPLVLTKTDGGTAAALYTSQNGIQRGYVLGGSGLISDATVRWIFHMAASDSIDVR